MRGGNDVAGGLQIELIVLAGEGGVRRWYLIALAEALARELICVLKVSLRRVVIALFARPPDELAAFDAQRRQVNLRRLPVLDKAHEIDQPGLTVDRTMGQQDASRVSALRCPI